MNPSRNDMESPQVAGKSGWSHVMEPSCDEMTDNLISEGLASSECISKHEPRYTQAIYIT